MILVDTHCHLDLDHFDLDRAEVLERAFKAGVAHILVPGLNLPSSRSVVRLAGNHPMLSAAIGIHPTEASTWTDTTLAELASLASGASGSSDTSGTSGASGSSIVALGEIGLDYYWDASTREVQLHILRLQLDLAARLGLPVILHLREARQAAQEHCAGDLLEILETWVSRLRLEENPLAQRPGVLHSFSGSLETARQALRLGFYIGVAGPVTYRNSLARQEIVAALPLDHLLLETDAPFQTPHPYRGKRNEPSYVRLIADKIALLHSRTVEEVAAVTSENAERLFAWKEKV
ncbi:MAG TPA: TatD family hydrolase [Anaerolineales bacterium]|nr:TatD family hydrolase [Anaerolineales bacterium]